MVWGHGIHSASARRWLASSYALPWRSCSAEPSRFEVSGGVRRSVLSQRRTCRVQPPPRLDRSAAVVVRTIGHGTRTTDELAALLRLAGVTTLIDVRRYPLGRRQPHLSREALAEELPRLGIGYEWWGEALGGRRPASPGAGARTGWRNPRSRAMPSTWRRATSARPWRRSRSEHAAARRWRSCARRGLVAVPSAPDRRRAGA